MVKRAKLLDWLYMIVGNFHFEENSIIFSAMHLYDRFSQLQEWRVRRKHLTLVSCLMIATKLSTEQHLDVNLSVNLIFRGRYSPRYLVEIESRIAFGLEMDLDNPSIGHFISFYFKLFRLRLQDHQQIVTKKLLLFIKDCEELTMSFGKLLLLDFGSLST